MIKDDINQVQDMQLDYVEIVNPTALDQYKEKALTKRL